MPSITSCTHIKFDEALQPQCFKRIRFHHKKNPDPFVKKIEGALTTLKTIKTGSKLLNIIERGNHDVTINYSSITDTACAIPTHHENHFKPRVGSPTTINIAECFSKVLNAKAEPIDDPFEIVLAHELIHAFHNTRGWNQLRRNSRENRVWTNREEYNTIMGVRHNFFSISENAIRRELGHPERFSHHGAEGLNDERKKIILEAAKSHQPKF